MRYCGHFLIKAEGGAKKYERDHLLPLALATLYCRFRVAKGIQIRETHFSSAVLRLRNVGGVKCQLFLKHSDHWKPALKMIVKESGCFLFPEAVVSSTEKESLRSTERGSLQVLAVL